MIIIISGSSSSLGVGRACVPGSKKKSGGSRGGAAPPAGGVGGGRSPPPFANGSNTCRNTNI